jgi:crossover junction endodeoxyribonuclease RusA
MIISLPYPPSANVYWRNFQGLTVVSQEARNYKAQAGWLAKSQDVRLLDGDIAVSLKLYRPQKKGDIDNRIKVLLDALQGVAFENDSQIVELHVFRYDDKANPGVEVELWQVVENERDEANVHEFVVGDSPQA